MVKHHCEMLLFVAGSFHEPGEISGQKVALIFRHLVLVSENAQPRGRCSVPIASSCTLTSTASMRR